MATAALPAPLQPRRRELIFGTAFATAGVVAVMATLIGYYLAARNAGGADWFSANTIPLTQPNMQALTLAMSVVTMQWAVYAIARDDRTHSYLALGITLLLGTAFVNQSIFLFKQAAVTIEQPEGPLFYAVTVGSLLMVVAGMIFIALMAFHDHPAQLFQIAVDVFNLVRQLFNFGLEQVEQQLPGITII